MKKVLMFFLCAISIVLYQDCSPGFHTLNPLMTNTASSLVGGTQVVSGYDGNLLYQKNCAACHSTDGSVKTSTKLGRTAGQITSAIQSIPVMATILLNSSEVNAIAAVLLLQASPPLISTPVPSSQNGVCVQTSIPRRVWMLSRLEYDNSVNAILGLSQQYAMANFPPENRANGFSSNVSGTTVNSNLANLLMTAAETIAAAQSANETGNLVLGALASGVSACTLSSSPSSTPMDPCVLKYINSRGTSFYRRTLTASEISDLYNSYLVGYGNPSGVTTSTTAPTATAAQIAGIQTVLATLLQAPQFLYRTELGDPADTTSTMVNLTQSEVASELAYLTTASPPDATLMGLAQTGNLNSQALSAQYTRLINSPSGQKRIVQFVLEWLGADSVAKLGSTNGMLSVQTAQDMLTETQTFLQFAIFQGTGTLNEILTGPYTYLNSELAQFYGISSSNITAGSTQFVKVTTGSTSAISANAVAKIGLLSQGSFLATSSTTGIPLLHRGNLIRQKLYCEQLPSVASLGLPNFVPPTLTTPPSGQSVRDQLAGLVPVAPPATACYTCHQYFMPIGYGLENFDPWGRYRLTDNGASVNSSGWIAKSNLLDAQTGLILDPANGTSTNFTDFTGLATTLAKDPLVSSCLTSQAVIFSSGRTDLGYNDCLISNISSQTSSSGLLLDNFSAYVLSKQFIQRTR